MPKGATTAVAEPVKDDSDEDEDTLQALKSELAGLMARKDEIMKFADKGMRDLYLRWNTRSIEEVERKIRDLKKRKKGK